MKIKAEPIKGKDLKPGDLFSTAGPLYWLHMAPGSLGEKVYIRTDTPCPPDQAEVQIFKLTISLRKPADCYHYGRGACRLNWVHCDPDTCRDYR